MRAPRSLSEKFTLRFINAFVEDRLKQAARELATSGVARPRLLDIGCGSQPYRPEIERLGFEYFAMDIASRGVPLDIKAALNDAKLSERVTGGQYQVVLLTEVLEHIDRQEAAWLNLSHLIAAQGILIVTTPFLYPLHEEPWDACRPTMHQIRRFAERNDFTVVVARQAGGISEVFGLILANIHMPSSSGPFWWLAGRMFWAVLRLGGLFLFHYPLFNCMRTGFYVSNLAVCKKR